MIAVAHAASGAHMPHFGPPAAAGDAARHPSESRPMNGRRTSGIAMLPPACW